MRCESIAVQEAEVRSGYGQGRGQLQGWEEGVSKGVNELRKGCKGVNNHVNQPH